MKTMPAQGQELLTRVASAMASQLQPKAPETTPTGNGASIGLAGTTAAVSPATATAEVRKGDGRK
jgi:hypothetical protein